jgi:hypothetical protein
MFSGRGTPYLVIGMVACFAAEVGGVDDIELRRVRR